MNNTQQQLKPGGAYAWCVAIICALIFFTSIGMIAGTGFAIFGSLMMEEWGITNTQYSNIISVRTFCSMIGIFLCGVYYDKLSLRVGLGVGLLFGLAAFIVFAFAPGFMMKCVASGLAGFCYGFSGMVPIALIVANWFNKYRNTVIGVCYCSSGLASTILPGILTSLSNNFSLETALIAEAVFAGTVAILAIIILRDKPGMIGRMPVGTAEDLAAEEAKQAEKELKKARHRETWVYNQKSVVLLYIVAFVLGAINYTAYNYFAVNLTTAGWSAADVSKVLTVTGLALLIGKPIYGILSDLFTPRKVAILFFACCVVAHVMSVFPDVPNLNFHIIALAIYGIGGVLATNGTASYALDLCGGEENRKKVVKNSFFVYAASGFVCSTIMGFIVSATGTYRIGYASLAALSIVGWVLVMAAYRAAKPGKQKLKQEGV